MDLFSELKCEVGGQISNVQCLSKGNLLRYLRLKGKLVKLIKIVSKVRY